jgi:hypothetical protein
MIGRHRKEHSLKPKSFCGNRPEDDVRKGERDVALKALCRLDSWSQSEGGGK